MFRAGAVLSTLLLLAPARPCRSQEKHEPGRPEDIRRVVRDAGFDEKTGVAWGLESYVRFGSKAVGDRHAEGDQFDRLDIKKETEAHRAALRKKRFRVGDLKLRIPKRTDVETKGLVVAVELPLRVRGEKPFYRDAESFDGSLWRMHPCEAVASEFAFLTKDGTVRRCTLDDAEAVVQNKGVLYNAERGPTELFLIFKGKLEVLRDVSRNHKDYSVEVEFTDLCYERPEEWGYFRVDALERDNWDCQKLAFDNVLRPDDPRPNYFVTALREKNADRIPEVVQAKVAVLRVTDKTGKTIGGYKVPR